MRVFWTLFFGCLIGCSGAVIVCGQGKSKPKPDLSGIWRFDQSRSNTRKLTVTDEIKITHHDPELRIVRTFLVNGQTEEREFTYYTDGRGETNPATVWLSTSPDPKSPHSAETKSKTEWNGDRIVTRSSLRVMAGTHVIEQDVVDQWRLSADGKTLTQTTRFIMLQSPTPGSVFVPAARPDDKRVYTLVSK